MHLPTYFLVPWDSCHTLLKPRTSVIVLYNNQSDLNAPVGLAPLPELEDSLSTAAWKDRVTNKAQRRKITYTKINYFLRVI